MALNYSPPIKFSQAGKDYDTQEPWSEDFYDDSILNFDRQVGEIIDALILKKYS
jgi:hypothetical protein